MSLLPRIGWTQWKVHRDHGVNNRAQLAALDVRTAELVGQGVDVARLLEATEDLPPTIELGSFDEGFVGARELRTLDDAGFVTVGDLARLCRRTASYSGSGLKSLPAQIDLSRAALGPEAVYSRRGIERGERPTGGCRGRCRHGERRGRLLPVGVSCDRPVRSGSGAPGISGRS